MTGATLTTIPGGPFIAPVSSYAACFGDGGNTYGDATTKGVGDGTFYRNSKTRFTDITDGTSNTLLAGERCFANAKGTWLGAVPNGYCQEGQYNPAANGNKGQPTGDLLLMHNTTVNNNSGRNLDESSSKHTGGANMLFADGSVHFVRNVTSAATADVTTLKALATIRGGEVINTTLW